MEREVLLGSTRAHCPSGTEEEQLSSLVLSHTVHVTSAERFLFAPLSFAVSQTWGLTPPSSSVHELW